VTEIRFHFNVPGRAGYACRLLRKALRQNTPIAVTGPEDVLAEMDRELWAVGATEFLPHAWVRDSASVPERLRPGTIWLAPDPLASPVHAALLNLGDGMPRGFESFDRLIEVVSTDADDRAAARDRWKGYTGRGYAIERHEVAA